jgi:hypothetical protein
MRLSLTLLLSALLLGPASAQPAADPIGPVKRLYAVSDPREAKVYSKRLQSLFAADARRAKGEIGNLDFDFTVNGQDTEDNFKRTLRFEAGAAGPERASVKVSFRNFEPQILQYDLVRENGRWAIDEVRSLGKDKWVLSRILAKSR